MNEVYINSAAQISIQKPLSDEWLANPIHYDAPYARSLEPDFRVYFNPLESRRMGPLLKRALVTSTEALKKAGLEQPEAIITGTGLGCVENTELLLGTLCTEGEELLKPTCFMPSKGEQERRIRLWNSFIERHREPIQRELTSAMHGAGFQSNAFDSFISLLDKEFKAQEPDSFTSIGGTLAKNYLWTDTDGTCYVNNYVYVPSSRCNEFREKLPEDEHSYIFASGDVGNQLIKVLSDSFNYIGTVCSLIVLLFLCLSFGSVEIGLLSFFPLAISWIWILGIMGIFGLQFNIVNVILATFIFGQGDDYTIFISEGLIYEYTYGKKQLASYKNGIILSALIMFVGIGALVVSRHPAMAADREFPGLKDAIDRHYTSTPLTYRDFTGTPDGSMYGLIKDVSMGAASHVSHRTKIPNLLLTGQSINSHGMLGVMISSVVTCSALTGESGIIDQINKE